MKALFIPTALDVIIPFWYYLFTPVGLLVSGGLIAAVVIVTILLIRRFYGKKK